MAAKAKQKSTEAVLSESNVWTPRRWSKEVLSAIPWNDYQMRVFEALEESCDNIVISATAGSGKSTLLKGIIGLLPPSAKINVMMFNVSVKDAFEKDPRIPKRVTVSTAHGCGYGLLIGYFRGEAPQVDDNKAHKLSEWGLGRLKELMGDKSRKHPVALPKLPEDRELAEVLLEKWRDALKQLIDMARLNLANNDVESLEWVANYFAIRFPFGKRGIAWGIRMAIDLLEDCFRMGAYDRQIDYCDMVWLPHKLKLYPRKPKAANAYLLVDECVTGDTLVTLADGSTRRIDEIVEGKLELEVLSFNKDTTEIEVKKIYGWHKVPRQNRKLVNVHGLTATFDHPIWTQEQGYVYAGDLNTQHSLLQIDGQKLQSFRQTHDDRTFHYNWIASWRCFNPKEPVERKTWQCESHVWSRSSSTRLFNVEVQSHESMGWRKSNGTSKANSSGGRCTGFQDFDTPSIYRNSRFDQTKWEQKRNYGSYLSRTEPASTGSLVYGRWNFPLDLHNSNICFPLGTNTFDSSTPDCNGLRKQSDTYQGWFSTLFYSFGQETIFQNHRAFCPACSSIQTATRKDTGKSARSSISDQNYQVLQPLSNNTPNSSLPKDWSIFSFLLQPKLSKCGENTKCKQSSKNIFVSSLQQRISKSSQYQNGRSLVQDVQQGMWSHLIDSETTGNSTKASMSGLWYFLPIQQELQDGNWSISANLQQQMWTATKKIATENEWVYCIDVKDNHNFFGNNVLVKNCQDANRAFISLYKKFEIAGYRCIFVGDMFQGISGYMGALPSAMDTIIRLFNAKVLPLSESQRCPKSHVALASLISPQMKARADAIDGTCELMHPDNVKASVQPGDLVLCRFVAPLIKLFLEAKFFNGKHGVVRARDIAKEMSGFAKQVGKNCKWGNFHTKLLEQKTYLVERYKLAGQLTQADATEDRYQCLEYCYEFLGASVGSLKDFVAAIEEAFPAEEEDRTQHVIYSSIHSAKGDESQRVYIVGINLLPYYRLGMLNWQFQQEIYATFVALTRSKVHLYFVPLERDPVELEKLMRLPCGGLKLEYFEGYEEGQI